ncbi:CCE_0567 family metalloprotein [Psychromonas sp. PT13]|uniref:CCE_0567 family metalloprotein n=1 Tax=Psychromonas sp. PT13 TaxID=3439547 RepID=UPI003EBF0E43
MALTEEQKQIKKEFAKYKRKVMELAGTMHDIVEDTIWVDYDKLAGLSNDIEVAMKDVTEFKAKHTFLQ